MLLISLSASAYLAELLLNMNKKPRKTLLSQTTAKITGPIDGDYISPVRLLLRKPRRNMSGLDLDHPGNCNTYIRTHRSSLFPGRKMELREKRKKIKSQESSEAEKLKFRCGGFQVGVQVSLGNKGILKYNNIRPMEEERLCYAKMAMNISRKQRLV
ncbi:hypothetical protein AV530_015410 [Patagioenas fasciata monilis]|uniref:Uncharacterized protein n=1 Tax=Patagioenas fasciata monilis TaxID=372326 RepID=A0A1V4JWS4_PATFA|nr:hypothetical protein AV530_015410 [Patagioenas fasciata monilis]